MNVTDLLKIKFPQAILDAHDHFGNETVIVDRTAIYSILSFLKTDPSCAFDQLMDLCGVDYINESLRFEVVYHLYSLSKHHRLRVRVKISEQDAILPSMNSLWECADWFEREVFDMFGIKFSDHPNLKRILMWNEFEGHPLRKDYPIEKRQPIPVLAELL